MSGLLNHFSEEVKCMEQAADVWEDRIQQITIEKGDLLQELSQSQAKLDHAMQVVGDIENVNKGMASQLDHLNCAVGNLTTLYKYISAAFLRFSTSKIASEDVLRMKIRSLEKICLNIGSAIGIQRELIKREDDAISACDALESLTMIDSSQIHLAIESEVGQYFQDAQAHLEEVKASFAVQERSMVSTIRGLRGQLRGAEAAAFEHAAEHAASLERALADAEGRASDACQSLERALCRVVRHDAQHRRAERALAAQLDRADAMAAGSAQVLALVARLSLRQQRGARRASLASVPGGRRGSDAFDPAAPEGAPEPAEPEFDDALPAAGGVVESLAQVSSDLLRFLDPGAFSALPPSDSEAMFAQAMRAVTFKLMQACVAAAEQQDRHAQLEERAAALRGDLGRARQREAGALAELERLRRRGAGCPPLDALDPRARAPLEAHVRSLERQVAESDEERDGLVLQLLESRGDAERERQARRALERRLGPLEEELAAARRRAGDLAERQLQRAAELCGPTCVARPPARPPLPCARAQPRRPARRPRPAPPLARPGERAVGQLEGGQSPTSLADPKLEPRNPPARHADSQECTPSANFVGIFSNGAFFNRISEVSGPFSLHVYTFHKKTAIIMCVTA
jgi:hypothetical protein